MNKTEFRITSDGSHTLFVPGLEETYHSKHGAIQEALHVFIDAGLNYFKKKELTILEIGFGTGLNAFLTLIETHNTTTNVNYTGVEAFPLESEVINQLNYTKELNSNATEKELFNNLHQLEWEREQKITTGFTLQKQQIELDKFETEKIFDLIYFDAFGPRVQPEMWTKHIFEKMYNCLSENGILVTYCAKGSVKRTLKEVGFKIEALPGPPGKREMTRGIKIDKC